MAKSIQTEQVGLSQPSFLFILSMNNSIFVIGGFILFVTVLLTPITVHAQQIPTLEDIPPIFAIPEKQPPFDFGTNQELRELQTQPDFGWRLKIIGEDFIEFFTFNPLEKAQLKLQFAQERQNEIDQLRSEGLPIPAEYEKRRIQKLNEAIEIFRERDSQAVLPETISSIGIIESLREMAEFNEVKILVSQIPDVVLSPKDVQDAFNKRVNSLDVYQENCVGEFDVLNFVPLDLAFETLEEQCPRLKELEDRFGRDRIRQLIMSDG